MKNKKHDLNRGIHYDQMFTLSISNRWQRTWRSKCAGFRFILKKK